MLLFHALLTIGVPQSFLSAIHFFEFQFTVNTQRRPGASQQLQNHKKALQASRQERKGEPLIPQKMKKISKKPQIKKLQNVVWNEFLFAENTSRNTFVGV